MASKNTIYGSPRTKSYTNLLIRYQPKPIATDADYEAAIVLASELEHRANPTLEEETLLELLVTLIEKYEATHEPVPEASVRSVLLHLMDAQDLTAADLAEVLGGVEMVEGILAGRMAIDVVQETSCINRFLPPF